MQIIHGHAGIELSGELVSFGDKPCAVFSGPPVFKISFGIGSAALIVKTMGHFMADHRADAAVVHRVIRLGVEERRLQNSGGKHDFVQGGIVIGIYRRRGHSPAVAIDRMTEPGEAKSRLERLGPHHVLDV